MANIVETGIRYVGSVAGRSLGIPAAREQLKVFANLSTDRSPEWANRVRTTVRWMSGVELAHQIIFPAMSRLKVAGFYMDEEIDRELYPTIAPPEPKTEPLRSIYQTEFLSRVIASLPVEFAQLIAVALLSHNPLEVVAWKLAANAVTHVAFDAIEAARLF